MYTLSDQGERELALRYDLTIPLAKVIGMNPELRLPFKRYEMGPLISEEHMNRVLSYIEIGIFFLDSLNDCKEYSIERKAYITK